MLATSCLSPGMLRNARRMSSARPRDYDSLAPTIVAHGRQGEAALLYVMKAAAARIDTVAAELGSRATRRLSIMGSRAETVCPSLEIISVTAWCWPTWPRTAELLRTTGAGRHHLFQAGVDE